MGPDLGLPESGPLADGLRMWVFNDDFLLNGKNHEL